MNTTQLLDTKVQEIMDVFDGPEQECVPLVAYVTNPTHGGKVTCYKCDGFILEDDCVPYLDHQHLNDFPKAHFHKKCFSRYSHYYGLDRPLD